MESTPLSLSLSLSLSLKRTIQQASELTETSLLLKQNREMDGKEKELTLRRPLRYWSSSSGLLALRLGRTYSGYH
jgi:hypothetical protein